MNARGSSGLVHPNQAFFRRVADEARRTSLFRSVREVGSSLDLAALQSALERVVARHPVLGCNVVERDRARGGRWWQEYDLVRGVSPQVERSENSTAQGRRFPVVGSELGVALAVGTDDGKSVVTLSAPHHLIDDWSTPVFWSELGAEYCAAGTLGSPPMEAYADVVAEFYARWEGGIYDPPIRRWTADLLDFNVGELPSGPDLSLWPLPKVATFDLTSAAAGRLRELALQAHATPFMVTLAAFSEALRDVFGWSESVLTLPYADRRTSARRNVIGLCANLLTIRAEPNISLERSISSIRNRLLQEMADSVPYPVLLDAVPPLADVASAVPHIGVRQLGEYGFPNEVGGSQFFRVTGDADWSSAATGYGLPVDLLLDCRFSGPVRYRITYRADRVAMGTVAQLGESMLEILASGVR